MQTIILHVPYNRIIQMSAGNNTITKRKKFSFDKASFDACWKVTLCLDFPARRSW